MKLISLDCPKRVEYYGMRFWVPEWTTHLCVQYCGDLEAYPCEPKIISEDGWAAWDADDHDVVSIATLDLCGTDWMTTLVEVG